AGGARRRDGVRRRGRAAASEEPFLDLFLAGDAVARPRHRLEALLVEILPALGAGAVGPGPYPSQGLVHLLQGLAIGVRQRVKELLGVGARRLVGEILGSLVLGQAAVGLVLVVRLRHLALLVEEALLVAFHDLLVHQHVRGVLSGVSARGRGLKGYRSACVSPAGSYG